MPWFPMFCDLTDRVCLLCGGDRLILEKLKLLQPYGAAMTVICEDPEEEVAQFPGITLKRRAFQMEDIDVKPAMVLVSPSEPLAIAISTFCREQGVPVNVLDMPQYSSFSIPAMLVDGNLTVGISTAGTSPTAAAEIKREIQKYLPQNIGEIVEWMGQQRKRFPDCLQKGPFLLRICRIALAKERPLTMDELDTAMQFFRIFPKPEK